MRNTGRRVHPARTPSRWPGGRRGSLIKLALLLVLAFISVSIALRLSAPYLVSSSVVRSAIASSIAEWTGHDVSIDDVSEVRFWPRPTVRLNGIVVSRERGGKREIIGEIDHLTARFGLISALMGRPDFSAFRFERPRFRVARGSDGELDWSDEGLLSEAVRAAIAVNASDGVETTPRDAEIGSVEIVEGEITLMDTGSGTTITASALNADIDWPDLAAPLSGQATFQVGHRAMSLNIQTPTPLILIGGSPSMVQASVSLPGMRAQMQGTVSLREVSADATELDIRLTDVAEAAATLGFRLAGTQRWQTASLKAEVSSTLDEWRFEDLAFEINESRGDGILSLRKRAEERPVLNATLAVDHLELQDLLQALSINVGDRADVRLPGLNHWVDIDMRLSADTANYGKFPLTDLGASLIGRGDTLKLVIADTRFLGGTLSARLSGAGDGFDKGAEVAVVMDRVDLGSLTSGLAPGGGPSLKGLGSVNLNARLVGTGWQQNIDTMSGSLTISSDSGELANFDASGLRRLAADRAYFQLSAAGSGSFDYRTLDMAVRFADGSAEVERARIVGEDETLVLSGIIPYSRQALALTGELLDTEAEQRTAPPLRFFIGGGWNDPVISPIPDQPASGQ